MMSIMEEVFLRFPHIGIQFFEKLDDSNLAKCREVSKSWKNFIDSEELPRKRIHHNCSIGLSIQSIPLPTFQS